jgi:hypothetical protein
MYDDASARVSDPAAPSSSNTARLREMSEIESYKSKSREAKLSLRYAFERLNEMYRAGRITGLLFQERQRELTACIKAWRCLSEAREDEIAHRASNQRGMPKV